MINIALLAHLEVELFNLGLLELPVLTDEAEAKNGGQNDGAKNENGCKDC